MEVTVKEFVSTNNNPLISWEINGHIFNSKKIIPENLLEANVWDWSVNLWDGIIEVSTRDMF